MKGKLHSVFVVVCTAALLALGSAAWANEGPPAAPDPISLDPASPSVVTFGNTPGDMYGEVPPGGVFGGGWDAGGPGPVLHVADVTYGLVVGDNNDGHSNGEVNPNAVPIIYFSADDASLGVVGTEYRWQSNLLQAAGDRFVTNGPATLSPFAVMAGAGPAAIAGPALPARPSVNLLSLNQDKYNEIPSIRPLVKNTYVPNPGETMMDDMDAVELNPFDLNGDNVHDTPVYFSLDANSPSLGGFSSADVFLSPPGMAGFGLFAGSGTLGLVPADELDALAVYDVDGMMLPGADFALFSLAPGSPFLLAGGFSAADIFVTDFTGLNALYLSAGALGLLPTDNLDALDVEIGGGAGGIPQVDEIPEPTSLALLGLGCLGMLRKRK